MMIRFLHYVRIRMESNRASGPIQQSTLADCLLPVLITAAQFPSANLWRVLHSYEEDRPIIPASPATRVGIFTPTSHEVQWPLMIMVSWTFRITDSRSPRIFGMFYSGASVSPRKRCLVPFGLAKRPSRGFFCTVAYPRLIGCRPWSL